MPVTFSDDSIDRAARHLRETLQSGKVLKPWDQVDKQAKKKWVSLATGTLHAAAALTSGAPS